MMDNRSSLMDIWVRFHSIFCLLLCLLAFLTRPAGAGFTLSLYGIAAFTVLFLIGKGKPLRPANLLTMLRLFSAFLFSILLKYASIPVESYIPAIALSAAELTDYLDGYMARKSGISHFGARLDEETDAFFMLLLSTAAVTYYNFPAFFLFIGLIRYAFVLLFAVTGKTDKYPQIFTRYSRFTCAFASICLIAAFLPILPRVIGITANGTALGFLIVSFLWELSVHVAAPYKKGNL